jgi:glycosyltransferase involved in cell wall biosynthesis
LIAHDDGAYATYLPARFQPWAERNFAAAYRAASSRFCISPAMAEIYEQRYGQRGRVMYPTRDPTNPVFGQPAPRILVAKQALTFAYAGSIYGEPSLRQILAFAQVARGRGHRLLVYSPQHMELTTLAGADRGLLDVRPPLPSAELLRRLRDEADCLVVTSSFDPREGAAVSTLFPSKVADYSAAGLPLLAWAPLHASIARFVRENAGAAELVTEPDAAAVGPIMDRLASSPEHRRRLAENLIALARRCFSPEAAWDMFSAALRGTLSA